jgi:hypothetical protein
VRDVVVVTSYLRRPRGVTGPRFITVSRAKRPGAGDVVVAGASIMAGRPGDGWCSLIYTHLNSDGMAVSIGNAGTVETVLYLSVNLPLNGVKTMSEEPLSDATYRVYTLSSWTLTTGHRPFPAPFPRRTPHLSSFGTHGPARRPSWCDCSRTQGGRWVTSITRRPFGPRQGARLWYGRG